VGIPLKSKSSRIQIPGREQGDGIEKNSTKRVGGLWGWRQKGKKTYSQGYENQISDGKRGWQAGKSGKKNSCMGRENEGDTSLVEMKRYEHVLIGGTNRVFCVWGPREQWRSPKST